MRQPNRRFVLSVLLLTITLVTAQASSASDGLPKVVLVGDSIRLSYQATVVTQLEGKAVVVASKANGGDSNNVLKHLDAWVIREKPTVVHINCGIHDTKKFTATGKFQVSPNEYAANLREIVTRIRQETTATVVFASSTPILDDRAANTRSGRDYALLASSIEHYNEIAKRVMHELNVPVNDLHKAIVMPKPSHSPATLIGDDGVHLTAVVRELLGKQVAAVIRQHLPKGE